MLEADEEVTLKLEGISGEGGCTCVENEDGKAAGLKRGVKENMLRWLTSWAKREKYERERIYSKQ
jgi:hypothetical protein